MGETMAVASVVSEQSRGKQQQHHSSCSSVNNNSKQQQILRNDVLFSDFLIKGFLMLKCLNIIKLASLLLLLVSMSFLLQEAF